MSELKGLIFDVDGTLADTEQEGHRVAFNLAFADAGLDWMWDVPTYERLLRVFGGKERIHHFIKDYLPDFESPSDLQGFVRGLHKPENPTLPGTAEVRRHTFTARGSAAPVGSA